MSTLWLNVLCLVEDVPQNSSRVKGDILLYFISFSIIRGQYFELFLTFCKLPTGLAPVELGLSVKWGCIGQNQSLEIDLVLASAATFDYEV